MGLGCIGYECLKIWMKKTPNGSRYPLVGGTRERHFDGTNFKPRKLPENAQTPTSRVHAMLGGIVCERISRSGSIFIYVIKLNKPHWLASQFLQRLKMEFLFY